MTYTESLPYEIEKTARILQLGAKYTFNHKIKCDITHDEFVILETLINNPGISQSDLSKLVLKGRSHTSKILFSLEKKEYITRTQGTKNGKMIYLMSITDKGLKLYEEVKMYLHDVIILWQKRFKNTEHLISELKTVQNLVLETIGDISLE